MDQSTEHDELAAALGIDPTEWDALALRSGSVLQSREWLGLWWQLHQRNLPLIPLAVHDADGRLSALLPLVQVRTWPRVMRPVGQWPPAELSLVGAARIDSITAAALADQLYRRSDWSVLQTMGVPADLGFDPGARGYYVHNAEPNRSAVFGGSDWETYLRSRSRNFREQIRRRERRLERDFRVTYRRSNDQDRLPSDVAELFRLHRLRWPDSSVVTPRTEDFHLRLLQLALERDWLSLWFLELDGRNAACVLSFRFGGIETFYQTGRDPEFEGVQAGLALTVHTMREAADAGITEFRFLRGSEEYKHRLSDTDHPVANRLYGHGPVGLTAAGAIMARGLLSRH